MKSKGFKKISTVSLFALIIMTFTSLIIMSTVGINDYNQPKTIDPRDYWQYRVNQYKNYKVTIEAVAQDEDDYFDIFVCDLRNFDDYEDGTPIEELNTIYEERNVNSVFFEVVIPTPSYWHFVFHNPRSTVIIIDIKIDHQHILWWLWIVIPSVLFVGIGTYSTVEYATRYRRASMNTEKAIKKLKSRSEAERKRAIYWLGRNGTKEEVTILSEMLNDENVNARHGSAATIGLIIERNKDRKIIDVLMRFYQSEENESVKIELVNSLCLLPDPRSVPILTKYLLIDKNEKLRYQIAVALSQIASVKAVPALAKVLEGENTDSLKRAAKKALEEIAEKEGFTDTEKLIKKYGEG